MERKMMHLEKTKYVRLTQTGGDEDKIMTEELCLKKYKRIFKVKKVKEESISYGHDYCNRSFLLETGEVAYDWDEGNIAIPVNDTFDPLDQECDYITVSLVYDTHTKKLLGVVKTMLVPVLGDIKEL